MHSNFESGNEPKKSLKRILSIDVFLLNSFEFADVKNWSKKIKKRKTKVNETMTIISEDIDLQS